MAVRLSFHRRPMPIFADHRPMYKIGQLLLVLQLCSRGGKSSFIRLQLFNWVLKDSKRQPLLLEAADSGNLNISAWGLDPALNGAVQFALAEELLNRTTNGVAITTKGVDYVTDLITSEALAEDARFLEKVGKAVTESMITRVSESWG